jgi:hypothetical protein
VTVREVEQTLGVTYKTAWHMVQKLLGSVDIVERKLRSEDLWDDFKLRPNVSFC